MPGVFSKLSSGKPRYILNQCYINAAYNRDHIFRGLGLRLVIGSLGLNGHYEFGGEKYTVKDFKRKWNDSHAWLEDKDGNVYDYIFAHYAFCARTWGKTPTFETDVELVAMPKDELRKQGLSYVPACAEAQAYIGKQVNAAYGIKI